VPEAPRRRAEWVLVLVLVPVLVPAVPRRLVRVSQLLEREAVQPPVRAVPQLREAPSMA
jgi:hypothetical protein